MATTAPTESLNESILDDESPCEYGHEGVAPCSLIVTHRVTGCTPDAFNVCATAVAVIRDRLPRDLCVDCGHRADECWRLIPV
jgi:hypothetical protein